jgi:hypothetical protein
MPDPQPAWKDRLYTLVLGAVALGLMALVMWGSRSC